MYDPQPSFPLFVMCCLLAACGDGVLNVDDGSDTVATDDPAAVDGTESTGTSDAVSDTVGDPATSDPADQNESDPSEDPTDPVDPAMQTASSDPLEGLPTGIEQWNALCGKGYQDTVTEAFCAGDSPPALTSLADVRSLLGLELVPGELESATNGNPGFAVVTHSTAIGMRHVNELNPRVVIFTPPRARRNDDNLQPNDSYDIIAFSRGEPFVELASKDPATGDPRFFLLRFEPSCEDHPGGCTNHDLYTDAIEQNWSGYTLYDDETIGNTTLDCLQCHQPDGPGTPKILRMHEFTPYWNHWVSWESPTDDQHRNDFGAAHAGEGTYGGLPVAAITTRRMTNPGHLEALLKHNGFGNQPNMFDSIEIDRERNDMGRSPTWEALYAESVAGREIAAPHWSDSPSDPALVSQMITAYQDVLNGDADPSTLPDISQTIPESEWADLSIRPAPGLDGRGIMRHMCMHCHNSKLDQSISRAGFNVEALDTMPRDVKDEAIDRLLLPDDDRRKMPPPRFHELSDAERDLVIEELEK